jgi:transcriptional regulator with XRE-family HTH domain
VWRCCNAVRSRAEHIIPFCSLAETAAGILPAGNDPEQDAVKLLICSTGLFSRVACKRKGPRSLLWEESIFFGKKMPGTVIKKYREMRNYSQKYVASRMGISQNAYSKIENNITQLTVHHVKQLSRILDLPVTDLLKDDFEIHKPLVVPHTVSRSDLVKEIEQLRQKIEALPAARHHSYIVALSLLRATENSLFSAY